MVKKCCKCGNKLSKDDLEGIPRSAKNIICMDCSDDVSAEFQVSQAEAAMERGIYATEMWRMGE